MRLLRRVFPQPDTFGAKLVALSIFFAGGRLVWDVLLGPVLVPYLPEMFFIRDPERADSAAIVLALGYFAVVMPVLIFAGAIPLTFLLRPALRRIDAHRRLAAARVGQGLIVLLALAYYEIVWRYVAYPLAQAVGLIVSGLVLLWLAIATLSDRRRMNEPTD